MEIIVKKEDVTKIKSDVLIYATTEEELKTIDTRFEKVLSSIVGSGDFTGEFNKVHMLYPKGIVSAGRVLLLGLGKQAELDLEKIRRAFATAVQSLAGINVNEIAVYYTKLKNNKMHESNIVTCILEGLLLGNYRFSKYVTEIKERIKINIKKIIIIEEDKSQVNLLQEVANRTKLICNNVNFTRDLVNESGNITHPEMLEELAKKFAKEHGFKFKALHEKELKELGLNLLLAVGRGSPYSSRLLILEFDNNKKSNEHIVLIGKGITFDTGGLNLKHSEGIADMRCDMAGAATVLGMLKTASELGVKRNIAVLIPTCENMIGPDAYKPGDIITSYSGKTVEVVDTDAEGRLILADAITYAVKHLNPTVVLDFATLTGSIMRTFGCFVTGLFTNDDKLSEKIYGAGQSTYERVWRLPVYDEYKELMKGDVADLKNISKELYAGAITGAAFLEAFVEKVLWAHFDIGGSAWFDKQRYYVPKGGTGIGIRMFVELLNYL